MWSEICGVIIPEYFVTVERVNGRGFLGVGLNSGEQTLAHRHQSRPGKSGTRSTWSRAAQWLSSGPWAPSWTNVGGGDTLSHPVVLICAASAYPTMSAARVFLRGLMEGPRGPNLSICPRWGEDGSFATIQAWRQFRASLLRRRGTSWHWGLASQWPGLSTVSPTNPGPPVSESKGARRGCP
jgi:hypothetical protein